MKAIIVDDEPLAIRRLERLLEEHGTIEVIEVFHSPKDAINHLSGNIDCDVLFLDVSMPEITGIDIAKHIIELNVDIKVIFCYSTF